MLELSSEHKIHLNLMKKYVKMPSEEYNILEFNHYMKSDKMAYITYASIKSLIRKTD